VPADQRAMRSWGRSRSGCRGGSVVGSAGAPARAAGFCWAARLPL